MNKSDKIEQGLVKVIEQPNSDVMNLDLHTGFDQSMAFLTSLVKSKKLKDINTPETALAYYVKAKELGVPFMNALDHMFDVGGKTSLDVHLMRALVLKAGNIYWEEIYNNAPLYKYIDSTGQIIAAGYDESCLPDGYQRVVGDTKEKQKADYARIEDMGDIAVIKRAEMIPVYGNTAVFNYATKYKFTRIMQLIDGSFRTITEHGEFSIKEAIAAGLHLKKDGTVALNSPWIVYHRNMLEHRAWTFGARKIADDILMGCLERTELLDMNHESYNIDSEGEVTQ